MVKNNYGERITFCDTYKGEVAKLEGKFGDFNKNINSLYEGVLDNKIQLSEKEKEFIREYVEEFISISLSIYYCVKKYLEGKDTDNFLRDKGLEHVAQKNIPLAEHKLKKFFVREIELKDYDQLNKILKDIGSEKRYYFVESSNNFLYGVIKDKKVDGITVHDVVSIDIRTPEMICAGFFNNEEVFILKPEVEDISHDVRTFLKNKNNLKKYEKYNDLFNHAKYVLDNKSQEELFDVFYNKTLYHELGHSRIRKYSRFFSKSNYGKFVNEIGADFLPSEKGQKNFASYIHDIAIKDYQKAKDILALYTSNALWIGNEYPIYHILDDLYSIFNSKYIAKDVKDFSLRLKNFIEEFNSGIDFKSMMLSKFNQDNECFSKTDFLGLIKDFNSVIDKRFDELKVRNNRLII